MFVLVFLFTATVGFVNLNYIAKRIDVFVKQLSNLFGYAPNGFIGYTLVIFLALCQIHYF